MPGKSSLRLANKNLIPHMDDSFKIKKILSHGNNEKKKPVALSIFEGDAIVMELEHHGKKYISVQV